MSEFSGKCDVWDSLYHIHGVNDNTNWDKIEIRQGGKRLDIKSLKDLIKYAPYLITSSFSSKEAGVYNITTESFVDREERKRLEWCLENVQKAYRRCKRKKEEFIPEDVAKAVCWLPSATELEICRRVKEHPYSAKVDGLHTKIHNYFRENWLDAMIDYGWSEEEAKRWIYDSHE